MPIPFIIAGINIINEPRLKVNNLLKEYDTLRLSIIDNEIGKFLSFMKENKKTVSGLENIKELVSSFNEPKINFDLVIDYKEVFKILLDLLESLSELRTMFNLQFRIAKRYETKNKDIFIEQMNIIVPLISAIKTTLLVDVLKDGKLNKNEIKTVISSNKSLIDSLNN